MKVAFRKPSSLSWLHATAALILLALPKTSTAQTFYGTGGATNNAANSPNLAFGIGALKSVTGRYNTAIGFESLLSDTSGEGNTALGYYSLRLNATGYYNTAVGYEALRGDTGGHANTATGYDALYNCIGTYNTATGAQALYSNASGIRNVAFGNSALFNALGSDNIGLGYGAGSSIVSGSNNIDIGNSGQANDDAVIRIGAYQKTIYIPAILSTYLPQGSPVFISSNGQMGFQPSSRRFKDDVKNIGSVSDKLMQLRPVSFRYKQPASDGSRPLQYGLIAEEVAKVYPEMVQYDKQGKPLSVYYQLLTPLLLNEFQKEHQQIDMEHAATLAQNRTIAAQSREIVALKASRAAEINTRLAEITALKAELSTLRQAQKRQDAMLAKLTTTVEAARNKAPLQLSTLVQH